MVWSKYYKMVTPEKNSPKFVYLFNHLYFMKLFEITCAPMSYLRDLQTQELTTQSPHSRLHVFVPQCVNGRIQDGCNQKV